MKKLFIFVPALLVLVFGVSATNAAKPTSSPKTCATIQGGTITDVNGNPISVGYDKWGYNYQANMFNGLYDNYSRPSTSATSGDRLMMKWNDAWLSSKDCDGDKKLDRHFGFPTYIGSGAWLTNHASGTYDNFDVSGSYVINVNYLNTDYPEDLVLTQTGTSLIGTLALVGGGSPWIFDSGLVSGNQLEFGGYFDSNPSMRVTFSGTIATDGTMSGSWSDVVPGSRTGTWSTVLGTSVKTTCEWKDFVKIAAVPLGAHTVPDVNACPSANGLDEKMWYTNNGTQIGCSIWGDFVLIQEVSSDPCNQFNLMNYKSQLRSGLGNW